MSWRLLAEQAKKRASVFRDLEKNLEKVVEVAERLDPSCEVYLFGSVAEGRNLLSSDIDVLVATQARPEHMLDEMWRCGVRDPFEIHVATPDALELYKARSKLVRIG